MADLKNNKTIFLTVGIFILVLAVLVFFIFKFGGSYQKGLASLIDNNTPTEYTLRKTRKIKKITAVKPGEEGCVEITPDGTARIYEKCGEKLTNAARLKDPKNIIKLVNIISSLDTQPEDIKCLDNQYEILIETEEGNEKMCLDTDNTGSTGGVAADIIQTIADIVADLPHDTGIPSSIANPIASPYVYSAPPQASGQYYFYATPTPASSGQNLAPFTCVFSTNSGKRKPSNVSNIICSTDPLPGK